MEFPKKKFIPKAGMLVPAKQEIEKKGKIKKLFPTVNL
jgi:hypothetical protein